MIECYLRFTHPGSVDFHMDRAIPDTAYMHNRQHYLLQYITTNQPELIFQFAFEAYAIWISNKKLDCSMLSALSIYNNKNNTFAISIIQTIQWIADNIYCYVLSPRVNTLRIKIRNNAAHTCRSDCFCVVVVVVVNSSACFSSVSESLLERKGYGQKSASSERCNRALFWFSSFSVVWNF